MKATVSQKTHPNCLHIFRAMKTYTVHSTNYLVGRAEGGGGGGGCPRSPNILLRRDLLLTPSPSDRRLSQTLATNPIGGRRRRRRRRRWLRRKSCIHPDVSVPAKDLPLGLVKWVEMENMVILAFGIIFIVSIDASCLFNSMQRQATTCPVKNMRNPSGIGPDRPWFVVCRRHCSQRNSFGEEEEEYEKKMGTNSFSAIRMLGVRCRRAAKCRPVGRSR